LSSCGTGEGDGGSDACGEYCFGDAHGSILFIETGESAFTSIEEGERAIRVPVSALIEHRGESKGDLESRICQDSAGRANYQPIFAFVIAAA
jgi:hypothetical protein